MVRTVRLLGGRRWRGGFPRLSPPIVTGLGLGKRDSKEARQDGESDRRGACIYHLLFPKEALLPWVVVTNAGKVRRRLGYLAPGRGGVVWRRARCERVEGWRWLIKRRAISGSIVRLGVGW